MISFSCLLFWNIVCSQSSFFVALRLNEIFLEISVKMFLKITEVYSEYRFYVHEIIANAPKKLFSLNFFVHEPILRTEKSK